jgi:hypothetical protein
MDAGSRQTKKEAAMNEAESGFRAWYEPTGDGGAKIVVAGSVTEIDGSESSLVRAQPEDANPRVLRLTVVRKPYPGFARPHVAFKREIRYEAPADTSSFTDVHIESKSGGTRVKVQSAPK